MNTFSAEDGLSREVEKAAESKDDIASTPPASLTTATTEKNEEMAAEVDEKKPDDDNDNDKDDDDNDDDEDEEAYPSGIRLVCIVTSLCMTVFLFALDGTILATAQPAITDQFNSLDDISWYSAAFFLTTCAFQLPFGKAYALLNVKMTFIVSVLIFLVGSAVCGATPTSIGLIIGRAIAGIGGAGVLGGVFIIIAKQIPLRKRSLYAGFVGAAFSIASVLGPVIGGAFTTNVSWRWYVFHSLSSYILRYLHTRTHQLSGASTSTYPWVPSSSSSYSGVSPTLVRPAKSSKRRAGCRRFANSIPLGRQSSWDPSPLCYWPLHGAVKRAIGVRVVPLRLWSCLPSRLSSGRRCNISKAKKPRYPGVWSSSVRSQEPRYIRFSAVLRLPLSSTGFRFGSNPSRETTPKSPASTVSPLRLESSFSPSEPED